MRLQSLPILALACAVGCAPMVRLHARPDQTAGGVLPIPTSEGRRDEFLANLAVFKPGETARSVLSEDSAGLSGRVRILVHPDDTFEYQLTLVHADSVTFTTGELFRAAEVDGGDPVATLFSGESLSGPYVQLRGTGQVARTLEASALLEEIREAPGTFVVRVRGESGRQTVLAGALR